MPVLPSYKNQSIDLLCQLTSFYMRATLALNGLKKEANMGTFQVIYEHSSEDPANH